MAIQRYFGIDFGTTNSSVVECISYDGKTRRITHGDDEGRPVPSIVAIDKETGCVYTGRDAWSKRSELAQTCECIMSVKSLLEIDGWSKEIAGKRWSALDVAAEVFKALKEGVANTSEGTIDQATVAIPIGFSRRKRQLIREAAQKADIEIEGFVSEPTAAFFANYEELKSDETVVIFDWGGGTLDVSVLQNKGGLVSELATTGMAVAGDDIDERLARKLHAKIARSKNAQISFDDMPPSAQDMMLVRAERAKRALSEDDDAIVSLNRYGSLGAFRETVSYEWFEAIIDDIVKDAINCLDEALEESGVGEALVDRVVMVGGSSNIGPLVEKMEQRFDEKLLFPEETVWSISTGAAQLSQSPGSYHAAQNVGLILSDGSYFPLLAKTEAVKGWMKSVDFGIVDDSKEVRIVFSGSKDIDSLDAKRQVISVPSYRFLEEKIRVHSLVDENSVFRVEMKSNMHGASSAVVWEYDKLKLFYSLRECGL